MDLETIDVAITMPPVDEVSDRARYVCARTSMLRYRNMTLDFIDAMAVPRHDNGRALTIHERYEEAMRRARRLSSQHARQLKTLVPQHPRRKP